MEYLKPKEAAIWLDSRILFNDPEQRIDVKFLKYLNDTGRLSPSKSSLFQKAYSIQQLRTYVKEVRPR